jgi:hypothetical protein
MLQHFVFYSILVFQISQQIVGLDHDLKIHSFPFDETRKVVSRCHQELVLRSPLIVLSICICR